MGDHAHGHGHGHDHHHGHSHAPSADADRRWLTIALVTIAGFMGVEVVAGLLADSVALLSDAAHMLTDAGSIGLALVAAQLALRPASGRYTFGLKRAEILSAQVNGISLLVLGAVLGYESIRRLFGPPDVEGSIVIVVGVVGACVNVAAAWALAKAERQSLNVAGARAHVMADLYGSVAAIVGGVAVVTLDFARADAIAALVVVALMFRTGWGLVRAAGRVLLEGTPQGMDAHEIGTAMASSPGISDVHDLHVWEITSGFSALAAHVLVPNGEDCHLRRRELRDMLADRFGIEHVTLQVDHEADHDPRLLQIEDRRPGRPAD
ncbi:MAG: cation diffusion facilitator family transporter [Solirubrobacteraceae bacterium]|nr:cation diffusion facilitator family transporter [Solirubrobacteraceae bacterium]